MRYQLKQIYCRPWTLTGLSLKLIESHYENNYGGALRRLNAITEQLEVARFREDARPRHQRAQARGARRAQFDAAARALFREHGRRRQADKGDDRSPRAATSARSIAGAPSSSRWATRSAAAPAGCCSPTCRATGASSTSTRPSTRRPSRAASRCSRSTCTSTPITWTSAPTRRRTSTRSCATSTGTALEGRYEDAVKVAPPRPLVQPEFGDLPGVGVEEVRAMMAAAKPVQVIDARPRHSLSRQQDIAEGATGAIPSECRNGWASCRNRSRWSCTAPTAFTSAAERLRKLREAGFDARYMNSGHSGWKAIGGAVCLNL